MADLVFDVAYVGNRGLKLPAFRNLNQRPCYVQCAGAPRWRASSVGGARPDGDIQYLENIGISNYNSLQTRLERRFSAGSPCWPRTHGVRR